MHFQNLILIGILIYDIIILEDGVGGRTRTSDFIEFAINEEKATKNLISEMVAHELCHAAGAKMMSGLTLCSMA